MLDLYPHQQLALDGLRQSLRGGHTRPMLWLATGSGKTVIAAHIVSGALAKNNRVAFIVPLLSLIDQTFERFRQNGIDAGDMGVIQGDHQWYRPHAPAQICSAQTLARRGMPIASIYVVDEAHIYNKALVEYLASEEGRKITVIGLSATPWTRGLGRIYDDLVRPIDMQTLIREGFLCPFRVFAPSHPDLEGVKIDHKSGDYQVGELSSRMSDQKLVADIVSTWLDKAEGRPTLCFAVDRAHAAVINEQFGSAGVSSAYVDAYTTREERTALGKRLAAGELKVICNIGTMTTGVDLDVRCIIFARPTKSEMLFAQIIGRGLRTAPGKEYCLILDHSDSHLRLGMVTDVGLDSLDTGAPGSSEAKSSRRLALPKECPACTCLIPARQKECPHCGFELKRYPGIECEEGELIEIGARNRKPKESATSHLLKLGKTRLFQQIKGAQIARKRSPGWAAHTYKSITGTWPNNLKNVEPEEPSIELLSFIRHRDIAWAKSRKRENSHAA